MRFVLGFGFSIRAFGSGLTARFPNSKTLVFPSAKVSSSAQNAFLALLTDKIGENFDFFRKILLFYRQGHWEKIAFPAILSGSGPCAVAESAAALNQLSH